MSELDPWEEEHKKNKKRGAILSGVIHSILLILFLFFGLSSIIPPPGSIMINLGYYDVGQGDVIPETTDPVEAQPIPEVTTTPPPVENVTEEVVEEVVTQETVETVNIPDEVAEEVITDPVEAPEEIEIEPVEVIEEPEEVIEEPEETATHEFGGLPSNDNTKGGDGNTEEPGDQGKEFGDPDSPNYEGGSSEGIGTDGAGWGLGGAGWKRKSGSAPEAAGQKYGTVIISIKVDNQGNVIQATVAKGGTLGDPYYVDLAKKEAMKWKFIPPTNNRSEIVFGHITFDFKLQ